MFDCHAFVLFFFRLVCNYFAIINIWLDQYVNKCQIKINWFRILYIIQIYNVHVSWSFSIGIYKWVEFSVQSWLWRVICPTIYKSWRVDWVSGKKNILNEQIIQTYKYFNGTILNGKMTTLPPSSLCVYVSTSINVSLK